MTLQCIIPRGALVLTALALGGCASSSSSRPPTSGDTNTVTRAEIEATGAITAYEVLERLRPRWLRVRTSRSFNRPTTVVVFVDNLQLEGIRSLWDVEAANIVSIRWFDSAQAGQLPGLGSRHVQGAIVVETQ